MVLGANMELYGGGQFEIVGVVADHSDNLGDYLRFEVMSFSHKFYIGLFALNCAPRNSDAQRVY